MIPEAASAQNKLADKNFVNSSIQTATADFKGTFNSLAELQQVPANANDYGYVVSKDAEGNPVYSRYKYVEGTGWVFEYNLNNSSFTAAQWAAIQSGITAMKVAKLDNLSTNDFLQQLIGHKPGENFDNFAACTAQSIIASSDASVYDGLVAADTDIATAGYMLNGL